MYKTITVTIAALLITLSPAASASYGIEQSKQLGTAYANEQALKQCYNKVDSKYAKALLVLADEMDHLSSITGIDYSIHPMDMLKSVYDYPDAQAAKMLEYGSAWAKATDKLSELYKTSGKNAAVFCDALSDKVLSSDNLVF